MIERIATTPIRLPVGFRIWMLAGTLAFIVGALATREDLESRLLLTTLLGTAILLIVTPLGLHALLLWIVLAPLAYPFVQFPRDGALVTFDRVWVVAMIGIALAHPQRRYGDARESRFLALCLLWLSVEFLVRTFTTPGSGLYAARIWVDAFLLPLILFFVARRLTVSRAAWTRIAGTMTVAGFVLAVIGIAQKVIGFELATLTGGEPIGITGPTNIGAGLFRISGPYPYSEMYGLVLLICFAATLYLVQVRDRNSRLAMVIVGFETVAIAFTFFRATWIGAAFIAIAAFGIRPQRFGRLIGATVIVSLVVLAVAAPLRSDPQFADRLSNGENVNARLATYITGVEIFKRDPLVGVGFGRFAQAEAEVPRVEVGGEGSIEFAHSSYVWVLAEHGLMGAIPLLLLTFAVWRLARALGRSAHKREDILLRASLVGVGLAFLVMSLTLTMLPEGPPNQLFAVMLGAASARLSAIRGGSGS